MDRALVHNSVAHWYYFQNPFVNTFKIPPSMCGIKQTFAHSFEKSVALLVGIPNNLACWGDYHHENNISICATIRCKVLVFYLLNCRFYSSIFKQYEPSSRCVLHATISCIKVKCIAYINIYFYKWGMFLCVRLCVCVCVWFCARWNYNNLTYH